MKFPIQEESVALPSLASKVETFMVSVLVASCCTLF